MNEKYENSLRGHEPKCKICNSEYQKEIEIMYESNHPYREIKEFLESKNELISQMALSRHFNNHYPKRKAYFNNIKKMEDNAIQEAIENYPHLKSLFQETRKEPDWDNMEFNEEGTDFKELIFHNRSVSDIFLHDNGYCLTEYRLCNSVPKKQTEYMEEILSNIDDEIENLEKYSFNNSKKIDLLNKKINCFECRDSTHHKRTEYIMHLLLKNFFNIEVESEKMNEFLNVTFDDLMFSDEVNYDFNKMDKILAKFKKANLTFIK